MAEIVAYPVAYGQRHVVLVVASHAASRLAFCGHLRRRGFHAVSVEDTDAAIRAIGVGAAFDLVLSSAAEGPRLARWIMDNRPDLPLVLMIDARHPRAELCGAGLLRPACSLDQVAGKIDDTLRSNRARPVRIRTRKATRAVLMPFGGR
ncbi:MAG: hypothetical protein ACREFW_03330 [Rhizomicrobium sp.]